jgi:hypothetical protein
MDNWNMYKGKQMEQHPEPATVPGARPADFPLGSLESRAAARRAVERREKSAKVIQLLTLIPRPPWAPLPDNKPPEPESKGTIWEVVFTDDPLPHR